MLKPPNLVENKNHADCRCYLFWHIKCTY